MNYKPGDVVWGEFVTTRFDTGAATNADSTPTATVNLNGTDQATSVTVTNLDTGRYKFTFTIPATWNVGDSVNVTVSATVNSVTGKGVVFSTKLGVGTLATGTAAAGGASTITLQTAIGADSLPNGTFVVIVAGTGAGQLRRISGYANSTKVATVDSAWTTNPDSTSVYAILWAGSQISTTQAGNLDAAVSSRSTYAGGDTSGTTTLLGRLTSTRAGLLDNIDVAVSTRSTYAGGDTSGTTTLLGRLTSTRAGLLDNLDAAISSRMASFSLSAMATAVWQDATAGDFTASGSIGKSLAGAFTALGTSIFTISALQNAPSGGGGGSDPWSTALPGSYAAGTAGYILAATSSGVAALQGATIEYAGPTFVSGVVNLVRGDSYKAAAGRQLRFLNTAGNWPNLANYTHTFYVVDSAGNTVLGPVSLSVIVATGTSQELNCDLTTADTTIPVTVKPGGQPYAYVLHSVPNAGGDGFGIGGGLVNVSQGIVP